MAVIKNERKMVETNLRARIGELEHKCEMQESRLHENNLKMNEDARTIKDLIGKIESLEKVKQYFAEENVVLREDLQRTMGYIDRVNEDAEQPEQFVAQQRVTPQRGPHIQGNRRFGGIGDNDIHASMNMSNYGRNRY